MEKLLNDTLNKCFSSQNRYEFLSFLGRFPNLSSYNAVIVFAQCPDAVLLASSGNYTKSGIKIKNECINNEITVLLPLLKMVDDGTADKNENVKDTGIAYINYPSYECRLKPLPVYDISQTYGGCNEYLPKVINNNILELFKNTIGNVSCIPTDDEEILKGSSCVYKNTEKGRILYVANDFFALSLSADIIRAFAEHYFEKIILPFFTISGRGRDDLINASLFVTLSHYGMNTDDFFLGFIDGIESRSNRDKLIFIRCLLAIVRSIITLIDGNYELSLEAVLILRCLTPLFKTYGDLEYPYNARNIMAFLKNMSMEYEPGGFHQELKAILNETIDIIGRIALDEKCKDVFEKLVKDVTAFNIKSYPVYTLPNAV